MSECTAKTPRRQPKRRALKLDKVRLDGDTQPRVGINTTLVAEYAEAYENNADIPPVVVFFDGSDYWLADGFHRWHAQNKRGVDGIYCEIHNGTVEDARWYSYAANQTHGQRRANSDKQKAVKAALLHPNGACLSDHQVGEHVGVSAPFVGKIRKELEASGQLETVSSRTGKDGRTRNTTNIGHGKAAEDVADVDRPGADDSTTRAAKLLDVPVEMVEQAGVVLHSDDTEIITAVESGDMELDVAAAQVELETLVRNWITKHAKPVSVAAAMLENLAAKLRADA